MSLMQKVRMLFWPPRKQVPPAAHKLFKSGNAKALAIAKAIQSSQAEDKEGSNWFDQIEHLRNRLLADESPLDSWNRPWLAQSTELRERLSNIDGQHETFSTSMSVSTACKASKSAVDCRFLYRLLRATRPGKVLELGTNIGISGCYIGAALAANKYGHFITLEGSAPKAALAQQNFLQLGLDRCDIVHGDFFDTLLPVVKREHGIDLAFIDGFHEGDATIKFHRILLSGILSEAIFVYDDIDWSNGMKTAWEKIKKSPEVLVFSEYNSMGICVVNPKI